MACERSTIDRGTPSVQLMKRAGVAAANWIAGKYLDAASSGVAVFAGSGNNGGDGWVVAGALSRLGLPTRVLEIAEARTQEAIAVRADALEHVEVDESPGSAAIIVDAMLGTGASGSPRNAVATGIARIATERARGATVVALDLPSGVDATTGEHDLSVVADASVSFGTLKRGHLIARDVCGKIAVVDISLDAEPEVSSLPLLIGREWVNQRIPAISPVAHKGSRKRLTIVGGGAGMAGAAILAGEGALRSGIGLLRIAVSPRNILAVHAGIPAAIAGEWPLLPDEVAAIAGSSDALVLGPGLGASSETRELVERILLAWSGPVLLDADALNVFEGDVASLATLLRGRPAVITPHPAEMARLLNIEVRDVLASRFDIGSDVARTLGAAVLLKGTPTVITSSAGERLVSAAGTAALATGGSGDVLSGIIGTLLAQGLSGPDAAGCGAFIHGRAAEICAVVRGVTLDDVIRKLPIAWNETALPYPPGVLAELELYA